MDNPKKLATQGTQDEEKHRETGNIGYKQDEEKQYKNTTQYVLTPLQQTNAKKTIKVQINNVNTHPFNVCYFMGGDKLRFGMYNYHSFNNS